MPKINPKRSTGSKAQASRLENEMKGFLGLRSRTTAYRAATYKPTLEKFQSTSFSDYVRRVLMGVPVEGVEADDPYFSNDDESEGDNEEMTRENGKNIKISIKKTEQPNEKLIEKNCLGEPKKKSSHPDALVTLTATANQGATEKETPKQEKGGVRRMTTRSRSGATISKHRVEKENIYSKCYQYKRPPSPRKTVLVASDSQQKQPLKPPNNNRKNRIRGPPLEPDSLKLSDGIAKITPPIGWWDKAGIGKDSTARGEPWQKGTKLGDIVIPQPIKQCVSGIGGIYDFTMMELPSITVAEFRDRADAYRKRQMGKEIDDDESDDHMDLLARKFWKRLGPTMESSQYGADMEGTLFDGDDASGWNIDKLESCLALLEADYKNEAEIDKPFRLPGVTSAYLYFGMWASVFSAHTEDMNLLSINYLHAGAPKYWYAIAQEDSDRFESLMASMFSHQATSCPEFLRHKRSLLSPSLLTKAGISYTTQVQRAGDIIITFPGSYHFGFNTGFNCAESTNFAVPEWVPFGEQAKICMCHPHSVRIDMRRFKILLDEYENAMLHTDTRGSESTYSQWVKEFIRRKKRRRGTIGHDNDVGDSKTHEYNMSKNGQGRGKANSNSRVVEVMKLVSKKSDTDTKMKNKKSTSKKRKATKKKQLDFEDFRLALPMKPSHLSLQVSVLCLLECDSGNECYFAGTIVDVVDNHAKVHFTGSTRNDDVWLSIESGKLFLDGGGKGGS